MAVITSEQRLLLHKAMEAVVGSAAANVLMAGMPARDWDDLATKADVTAAEERLRKDLAIAQAEHGEALAEQRADFHKAMNSQTRTIVFATFGLAVTVVALPQVLDRVL